MAVGFSNTNKPINPRGNDASPKGYNRASLYSGKALDFDGVNDEVDLGTQSFITESGFSISTYLNLDDNSEHYIFSTGYSNADSLLFYSASSSTTFGVSWYDGSSATLSTAVDYTIGEWFHALITYDGTTLKIYKNGVEVVSEAFAIDNIASGVYEIGWASPRAKSTAYLQGKVGGFKTFNTALTAAQVADLYNNPEKVVPTGVANTALKLWLPMQEGAGTTAYDGSGNGNHGTISGATYTHGIGAPVAQTAVIDWNKGTNEVLYSEDFSKSDWATSNMTKTTGQTDYLGGINAVRVTCSSGVNAWFSQPTSGVAVGDVTIGAYIKGVSAGGTLSFSTAGSDRSDSRINYTTEWVYYEWTITETSSSPRVQIDNYSDGGGQEAIDVYFCFPRLVEGTNADVYTPTLSTAQTSPVLLPQGLTTGRDITGVNLFENVRKQGALNLDGNSWAEVHDNESLDITDAITLEAWVYAEDSINRGILGKWDFSNSKMSYLLLRGGDGSLRFYTSATGSIIAYATSTTTITNGNWYHLVGTDDGTNLTLYLNGVSETTSASFGSIYESEKNVEIGRHGYGAISEINGAIAQPRIYNRALTASEVLRNYNSGKNTYTND